jgi:ADP-heptose:LPS heptosyltransferase
VQDLSPVLHDYGETALVLEALNLLISVDTSVVHLAGALGKPVWVLLSYAPDWRWGVEGERNPWYPSLRLFRQARPGAWAEVVAQITAALRAGP